MDEAVFRFHQMVHYFSTYGMELLFGVEVKHGWLPCENDDEKTSQEQEILLKAKTIKLLPMENAYIKPLEMILSRKERMTLPEKEIVTTALPNVPAEQVAEINVGFKENIIFNNAIIFI